TVVTNLCSHRDTARKSSCLCSFHNSAAYACFFAILTILHYNIKIFTCLVSCKSQGRLTIWRARGQ
ncbi:unnamed protein product, partial [Staurois parvus]